MQTGGLCKYELKITPKRVWISYLKRTYLAQGKMTIKASLILFYLIVRQIAYGIFSDKSSFMESEKQLVHLF